MLIKIISKILLKFYPQNFQNNKNKSIIKNNNIMNNPVLFESGLYQTISSLDSDSPSIIRIIGQPKDDENNYLTQDGQLIPSYILANNYVRIDAYSSKNEKELTKAVKNKLFEDFEPTKFEQNIQPITDEIISELSENKGYIPQINHNHLTIENLKSSSFDLSIFDNIRIDNLNKKSIEKFGEKRYNETKIPIVINFVFPYDIEKLKTAIELLSLDEKIVITELIKKIKFDYQEIISSKLLSLFNAETKEIKENLLSIDSQEINEISIDLDNEIKQLDDLINKY